MEVRIISLACSEIGYL